MDLNSIKGVAFDLDGTIYIGNRLIDGAADTVRSFRKLGKKICFFTNSSARTRQQTIDKLTKLGLSVGPEDEVFTSAFATAVYAGEKGVKECYCIGTKGLTEELAGHGIKVAEDGKDSGAIDAVIIGLDPEFSYSKLEKALNIYLRTGCRIIACNLDKHFPVENNSMSPGTGPIAAAVAQMTGAAVEDVGKPNVYMLEMLARKWGFRHSEILIVGDSLDSDMEMAKRFHSPSVLISKNGPRTEKDMTVVGEIKDLARMIEYKDR